MKMNKIFLRCWKGGRELTLRFNSILQMLESARPKHPVL